MNDRNKTVATIASIVGIGLCCVLIKYRSKLYRQLRLLADFRNPLRYKTVKVVNDADECRQVLGNVKLDCAEYNVLGFDCEWVTVGGNRRPVALLQLATHKGLCALIRLCNLHRIPPELREVLEDENIIKVGVAPIGDANYLTRDYGVCVANTLDLRFLAVQANYKPASLAKLSQEHLNVHLDKDWRIRCSDWEANKLSDAQIEYAAKDAHVAIELFRVFADRLEKRRFWTNQKKFVQNIIDKYCFDYFDIHFKTSHTLLPVSENVAKGSSTKGAVFSNKIQTRNIATRRKPLYYNCFLEAPDGELLCTCAQKKAMWYVHKNIGEVISESPFTVRLKFEPAGRAVGETGRYYQTAKINQCVVCGAKEKYIRKNIIPREYRKYFPFVMKDHTSHDVLLMCPRCHQISNVSDQTVRQKLAKQCDAPFKTNEGGSKTVTVPRFREIKSISRALYYQKDKIPEKRLNELKTKLMELCPEFEEITDDVLEHLVNIETTEPNEDYFAHGSKVVEYYKKHEGGLIALERLWREHFLNVMKPQFLPELWSVEHNVERLETRAHEGRIDDEDLKLAGIGKLTKESLHTDEQGNYDSDDTDSLLSQPRSDDTPSEDDDADDSEEEDRMINEEWEKDSGIKDLPGIELGLTTKRT